MLFRDKFTEIKNRKKSLLCVGLDPELEKLPDVCHKTHEGIFEFCSEIIKSTAAYAAAFKINFAFFERFGAEGWQMINNLRSEIPEDCLTIADAKRGDIGNSAKHYAEAIFGQLGFDAATVNPYMGRDSADPFLNWADRGIFFLGHTSNPGAQDFQYFNENDRPLYAFVAETVEQWNKLYNNCGLVVGATKPEKLQEIRQVAPKLTFLIPGIGAQGGTVEDALQHIGDTNALISASRSIIYASSGDNFAEAAAEEAKRLQVKMQSFIVASAR